jgi:outer membrane protein TolC
MKKAILIFSTFITIVSGQTEQLTIEKALQIGLNSSNEIKIANSDSVISDAFVTNAWSNLLPKVKLGFNYNHLSEMPIQLNLPLVPTSTGEALTAIYANATIEQPLFTGFRLLSLKNASQYMKEVSLLENTRIKNNKALEIHQAFWMFYKSLKMIEILEENLKSIQIRTSNIGNFVKTGLSTKNDLLKLQVAEADVKTKLIDAKHNSKIAQANFNRVIGLKLNSNTEIVTRNIREEIFDFDFETVLTEALDSRLELKANNFRSKAADEKITAAKSTWYPQIMANASYNYLKLDGASSLDNGSNNFWMVGVGMQWNIWDWWQTSSNASIAQEEHFQIEVSNKMLREKIEIEVYSNYLNIESEKSKIELSKLQVKAATENFRIIKEKFDSQVATTTELTEASTLLAEAKTKLITSHIDYKLARIKLEKSIGRKIY